MKVLLVAGAMLSIAVYVTQSEDLTKDNVSQIYSDCNQKMLSPATVPKEGPIVPSNQSTCVMACLFEKGNIIVNGAYKLEGALKSVEYYYGSKASDVATAKETIKQCQEQVAKDPDLCVYSDLITQCFQMRAPSLAT